MTQNNVSDKKGALGVMAEGIGHVLFLASFGSLVYTLDVYSRMSGWALVPYILFFLPALVLFVVVGSFAARKLTDFANAFYYENMALTVISILGILFLAISIKEKNSLFGPVPMNFELATQLILMFVVPSGIGFVISRSFYLKKKNKEMDNEGAVNNETAVGNGNETDDEADVDDGNGADNGNALEKFIAEVNHTELHKSAEEYFKSGDAFLIKSEFDEAIIEFVKAIRVSSPDERWHQSAKAKLKEMGFSKADIKQI